MFDVFGFVDFKVNAAEFVPLFELCSLWVLFQACLDELLYYLFTDGGKSTLIYIQIIRTWMLRYHNWLYI